MADFNISAGTTQIISSLSANSTDTVEGNSTAAYGAGGGTLNITGPLSGACNVTVTGGVLDVDGIGNNDTITLNNATLDITGGAWNSSTTINFGTGSSGVIVPSSDATSPNLGGVQFTGLKPGDYISTGSSAPISNVSWSNNTLSFTQNGINYNVAATLGPGVTPNLTVGTENGVPVVVEASVACFAAGTLILTARGEVAVEELKVGDSAITASGKARPIVWIGRQTISTIFADPIRVLPIRIKAGALGDNVPARDLLLSPDHAILIDGALIQAGALVNGSSIVRETKVPQTFTYYHVELDDHLLILAENTPAETFVDNVDRLNFDNWAEHQALYPEGKSITELPYPRAKAHRQVPVNIRVKLAERAQAIGAVVAAVA
jgi:hypothetical protein